MLQKGQFNWVFVSSQGHETITVTNLNECSAHLTIDIYFSNTDPVKNLTCTLDAERVRCFRLDEPIGDQQYKIPSGHYSLVLHSDVPVVAVINTAYGYSY